MVEIKNYCKSIKSRPILNNVSYNFEYGKIYGIYGHNGSGKTMLLRAIAGLLVPDSGSVVIDGKVLHKDMSFPPSIGIVIENMNLLPQYNAFDNLKILGKIKKTATDEDKERGALVVITTHHKEDLEEVCDVVLEMTEGELHEK